MNKEDIKWQLNNNILMPNVEEVEQYLKEEGFILVNSVNSFFPKHIYSDTYEYICLYYNHNTLELRGISKICKKGYMECIYQIPLEKIKNMCQNHPVKRSLEEIESSHKIKEKIEVTTTRSEW